MIAAGKLFVVIKLLVAASYTSKLPSSRLLELTSDSKDNRPPEPPPRDPLAITFT